MLCNVLHCTACKYSYSVLYSTVYTNLYFIPIRNIGKLQYLVTKGGTYCKKNWATNSIVLPNTSYNPNHRYQRISSNWGSNIHKNCLTITSFLFCQQKIILIDCKFFNRRDLQISVWKYHENNLYLKQKKFLRKKKKLQHLLQNVYSFLHQQNL